MQVKKKFRSMIPIVLLLSAVSTGGLIAAIIGISIQPIDVLIGTVSVCTPNDFNNTDPIVSTEWSQRKIYPNGIATPWMDLGTNSSQELIGEYPITYEMRLITTYGSVPGQPMPTPPTTHYLTRTVSPATGVRDEAGFDVETPMNQSILIKYKVQRLGQDTGPYLGGIAQERLRNRFVAGAGNLPDWDTWLPTFPSPSFMLNGGYIDDQHAATTLYWNDIPVPGIIETAVQDLRIAWSDPFGNNHEQDLGSQQIVHRKVSNFTWTVTH